MKKIAIIGAGISGLRAALELAQHSRFNVHIWEKAPSVGGRLATRRFEDKYVNHGTQVFGDSDKVLQEDPLARAFSSHLTLPGKATDLPKAMQAKLQESGVEFYFKKRVTEVATSGQITTEEGEKFFYDQILITSPLNQTREILKASIGEEVSYSKKILFIGLKDGQPQRVEMSDSFSEINFELSDEIIRENAQKILGMELNSLDLKKWRYAQVTRGLETPFLSFSQKIILASDAFDPLSKYNAASAWRSGLFAGRFINENF